MARAWAGEGRGFGATVIGGAAGLRSKASCGRKPRRCKPARGLGRRLVFGTKQALVVAGAVDDMQHLDRGGADAVQNQVASATNAGLFVPLEQGEPERRVDQTLALVAQIVCESQSARALS